MPAFSSNFYKLSLGKLERNDLSLIIIKPVHDKLKLIIITLILELIFLEKSHRIIKIEETNPTQLKAYKT